MIRPHPLDPEPSPMLANLRGCAGTPIIGVARPRGAAGVVGAGVPGPMTAVAPTAMSRWGWDEVLDRLAAELDRVRDHVRQRSHLRRVVRMGVGGGGSTTLWASSTGS